MDARKMKIVQNQPYDESLDVSDGEEIASNNPTPRASTIVHSNDEEMLHPSQLVGSGPHHQQPLIQVNKPIDGQQRPPRQQQHPTTNPAMMYEEEDDDDDESHEGESEEEEENDGRTHIQHTLLPTGVRGYDPAEYDHLQVSSDIKDLFQYITRYTPQNVTLETKLMPFIPNYVPAIGDIDAFLKVSRPDDVPDTLGMTVLDEPSAKQSDPNVLDLQLRTHAKQVVDKPAPVHSIENPDKNSKALDSWIENIKELHRQKPAANVHYTRNMPDIETLMQEWPPEFEELLKEVNLPTADLDCDLKEYVDILCGILDIPVHGNRIHSLHILFSLFMEFKNSQHFNAINTEQ